MRKWIALILAALQVGFAGFLIANGGRADRARERRMDEIVENGAEFLFNPDYFEYTEDAYADAPLTFTLYEENLDHTYGYYPLTAAENGAAIFGASTEAPPAEPYYALWSGKQYCRIDKATLHGLFGADLGDSDSHYYHRSWFNPEKNRFLVNDRWVSVYFVGCVYQGDVVFTGLVVDGVRY